MFFYNSLLNIFKNLILINTSNEILNGLNSTNNFNIESLQEIKRKIEQKIEYIRKFNQIQEEFILELKKIDEIQQKCLYELEHELDILKQIQKQIRKQKYLNKSDSELNVLEKIYEPKIEQRNQPKFHNKNYNSINYDINKFSIPDDRCNGEN